MNRVLISVEGQTEEIFIRDVLAPTLLARSVFVQPVLLKTKRPAAGRHFGGGVSRWSKIEAELRLLLRDSDAVITTMYDFYGIPADTPGLESSLTDEPRAKVEHVEQSIGTHMGSPPNFRPYLQLHEFEALVFCAPDQLAAKAGQADLAERLADIKDSCGGPELIDDGPTTAPSKRLTKIWRDFNKTLDGPSVVRDVGLASVRGECPHLDDWISWLESLGAS